LDFWFENKPSGNPDPRPSKIYPNLDFWFENKPSGNPHPTLFAEKMVKLAKP
jgi:hypothetical protein